MKLACGRIRRKRDGLGVRRASQGKEGVHLMLANPPWRSLRERAGKMPRPEARLRIGRIFSRSYCAAQFNKAQKRSDRGPLAVLVPFLHPGPVCGLSAGIDEDSRCRSRFNRDILVVSTGASGFIRTISTILGSLRVSLNCFFSSSCGCPTLGF
jgi:hypothetical protein